MTDNKQVVGLKCDATSSVGRMSCRRHKGLQTCRGQNHARAVSTKQSSIFSTDMKFAVSSVLVASSVALLGGCAAYPDGPGYGGGYPSVYDDPGYGYYGGGPVVQPGVIVNGGYYYGPGPRYWDDGPGWRRPYPPGGWHGPPPDRGHGGPPPGRGGGGPPPQAGGGGGRPPNAGGPPPQAGGGQLPRAVGGVPPGRPAAPPPSNGGGNRGGGGNPARWHEGPVGN
jgi:hypothetical protein